MTYPDGGTTPQPVPVQPQPQPQQPQRKSWFARHKFLTGLGVLVIVIVLFAALGGGGDDDGAPAAGGGTSTSGKADGKSDGKDEKKDEKKGAGVGDAVRDGKFEFTVTKVKTGVKTIGDEYADQKAQGQYVLVSMTVKNIGDEAQYFDGSSQKLVDTEGRTHSADSEAAIYLDDSNSFLNEINPGNTVKGVVVFDIPKDATPASLELHDSAFSGGVTVALR